VIQRDDLGRRIKLCKAAATIPLPLDYPVADMDDWLRIKPRYEFRPERVDAERIARAKAAQADGALVVASIPGSFAEPRQLMGDEAVCLAYYDQPELLHDMLRTFRETAVEVFRRVTDELAIDQLSVHEDLAGKSGPLVGPAQIEQFVKPYFRPIRELLASRGTGMFRMDTDGNVNAVVDAFLACGLTEIYPMEPAAGMDVVALRRRCGERLAMSGGIDKHVLRKGQADIRRELEYKMQPLMQQGGMIFGLDHRIPNGTPLANYRYYVDTAREMLHLPPRGSRGVWRRMAF
jgi:uroporphyrinogen-III decarboxylase